MIGLRHLLVLLFVGGGGSCSVWFFFDVLDLSLVSFVYL